MKKLFLILTLFILSFTNASYADVIVGAKAPTFTLSNTKGESIALDKYKGKIVVLEWFNEGCPFVKKHYSAGNMQKLQKEYIAKDVVWLSIVSSAEGKQGFHSAEVHNQILAKLNASPTALLLDPQGTVGKQYGAKTTPHFFIINKEGAIAYAGAVDDLPSTNAEDIANSKNYVRAALDEILANKPVTTTATESYGCGVKYAG